jgi:hypothetical protein
VGFLPGLKAAGAWVVEVEMEVVGVEDRKLAEAAEVEDLPRKMVAKEPSDPEEWYATEMAIEK